MVPQRPIYGVNVKFYNNIKKLRIIYILSAFSSLSLSYCPFTRLSHRAPLKKNHQHLQQPYTSTTKMKHRKQIMNLDALTRAKTSM